MSLPYLQSYLGLSNGIQTKQQSVAVPITRGIMGGGNTTTDTIDYITIASTGNATDFGNLTVARGNGVKGDSNGTRGVFGGGLSGSNKNEIDYITIANIGNATDFGDLTVARREFAAVSNDTRLVWGGGN
jgi:hypothetical protein